MKKVTFFAVAAAASVLACASSSFATVVYSQLSTAGLATNTAAVPSVLEDVNFSIGTTDIRQELTAMTFGYAVLPGTTAQTAGVFISFYDTFTPSSTGSVVSNYLGGFNGTLNINANTGTTSAARASSFTSLNSLAAPIYFTDNNLAVVITFTDSTGGFYSTILTPFTSTTAPTTGTTLPGVYRDANGDGTFVASDLNATAGNYYLSLTTINAAVPEPSTYAAAALGALALGGVFLRRNLLKA